jgi:hypothetical protein
MSATQQAIDRYAIEFRAVLGALGAIQLINGLWALLAPTSFYDDFPFGRGWVALLPAYNEHLMRDVGELFLASAVVVLAAAIYLEGRLVVTAIVSYLTWAIPHTIYHFFNLEPYGSADAVGNVIVLALTLLLPLWLLWRLAAGGAFRSRRQPAPQPGPPGRDAEPRREPPAQRRAGSGS